MALDRSIRYILQYGVFIALSLFFLVQLIPLAQTHRDATLREERPNFHDSTCRDGPYIWVQGEHGEGIGSSVRWHLRPFLMSNAVGAKLVVKLRNHHTPSGEERELGFPEAQDCNRTDMEAAYNDNKLHFRNATNLFEQRGFRPEDLCDAIRRDDTSWQRKTLNLTSFSVIVFKPSDLGHKDINHCLDSCLYTEDVRARFRSFRNKRLLFRPTFEIWVTLHFRWGDAGSSAARPHSSGVDMIKNPDSRTGGTLQNYVSLISRIISNIAHFKDIRLSVNSSDPTSPLLRLFMLSEGEPEEFEIMKKAFPKVELHLDSEKWFETLSIMSLSNILIGGGSSFFALGTNLCDDCYVITLPHENVKRLPPTGQLCDGPSFVNFTNLTEFFLQ